jgi:hypothetical protein
MGMTEQRGGRTSNIPSASSIRQAHGRQDKQGGIGNAKCKMKSAKRKTMA